MPYTPDEITALPAGTPVTMTYQPVDGPARTWHMQTDRHPMVVVFDSPRTIMTCPQDTTEPGATLWHRFTPAWPSGSDWAPRPEWLSDGDALLSLGNITMRPGAEGWSVEPITAYGRARIAAEEPARMRRERMIAAVAALDPILAQALDDTIDDLTSEARANGAAQGY